MIATEVSDTVEDQRPIETLTEWIFIMSEEELIEKKIIPLLRDQRNGDKNI
jgi:hypothetical protein